MFCVYAESAILINHFCLSVCLSVSEILVLCRNVFFHSQVPRVGGISDDVGLSREQRGLERLKLAQVAHVTRDSDTTFKVKRSKVNLQGGGAEAYCGGLPHSLF